MWLSRVCMRRNAVFGKFRVHVSLPLAVVDVLCGRRLVVAAACSPERAGGTLLETPRRDAARFGWWSVLGVGVC